MSNTFHCKKCNSISLDIDKVDEDYSLYCPSCKNWITNVRISNGVKEYFNTVRDFYTKKESAKYYDRALKVVKGKLESNYTIEDKVKNKTYWIYKTNSSDKYKGKEGYFFLQHEPYPDKYVVLNKI